jgi:hypothetical protein
MAFLKAKTTLLFKKEGTPYTMETSITGSDGCGVENISIKYDIPVKDVPYASRFLSPIMSVAGKRSVQITFDVPLHFSGTAGTAPKYFELLECCGATVTQYTTTGVAVTLGSDKTNVPCTMQVQYMDEGTSPAIVQCKAFGCMGTVKLSAPAVGDYARLSFDFKGVADTPTDRTYAQFINPTYTHYSPVVMLSSSVSLFGEAQTVNSFNVDVANTVELFSDPSKAQGYSGAHVVDRNPVIDLDPMMVNLATQDDYTRLIGNTMGAFSAQFAGPIVISAPKCQYQEAFTFADREGYMTKQKKLVLNRNTGDDEFEILHGAKA